MVGLREHALARLVRDLFPLLQWDRRREQLYDVSLPDSEQYGQNGDEGRYEQRPDTGAGRHHGHGNGWRDTVGVHVSAHLAVQQAVDPRTVAVVAGEECATGHELSGVGAGAVFGSWLQP